MHPLWSEVVFRAVRCDCGILTFNVSMLAEKAAEALDSGVRFMELTNDNAREWGYSGQLEPAAEETLRRQSPPEQGQTARRAGRPAVPPRNAPEG